MNDGNDAYEKNKRKRKIRSLENCIIIRYFEFKELCLSKNIKGYNKCNLARIQKCFCKRSNVCQNIFASLC